MAEKEYIEREAAIKYLESHKRIAKENNLVLAADEDAIIKFLREKCPAADVVEVRHGYWIHTTTEDEDWGGTFHKWTCSVCNKSIGDDNPSGTNYCRYCGAKMDGKGEGE